MKKCDSENGIATNNGYFKASFTLKCEKLDKQSIRLFIKKGRKYLGKEKTIK